MSNSKTTILVVENDPIIRMGAVDLVVDAGFDVVAASNADEAIQILEARSDIHLVFTDVEMPGTMDGLKLAHHIRNRWPPVKLIVASGKVLLDHRHLPAGARFFPKPYHDSMIADVMMDLLSNADGGVHHIR